MLSVFHKPYDADHKHKCRRADVTAVPTLIRYERPIEQGLLDNLIYQASLRRGGLTQDDVPFAQEFTRKGASPFVPIVPIFLTVRASV